ncbi:hypothetical protein [Saccharothrix sp. HUAS TT1]|uniref:hypothetical protein n=1 Tax=unclassified Saccharothrix TaxID=2593673 RepID=UPI00345C4277
MNDADETATRWVIIRRGHGRTPDEPLAVLDDRPAADRLCAELGEGHDVQPVPAVDPGRVRVVATWACRARLVDGYTPDVGEPERLAGAVRLVDVDAPAPWPERVARDEDAERLDALLDRPRVRHLVAYASTAERARELARERAERLAAGDG